MQTLPTGWAEARSGLYRWETKVTIAGTEYGERNIFSLQTNAALYAKGNASIGGCVAKEIDLKVLPKGEIPRMAEIRVWVRPVSATVAGGWLQKGVFYIDTRSADKSTGLLTIHGYDAMLKAEQVFLSETTEDNWPKPMSEVAAEIAARIGVELDERNRFDASFYAEYPLDYTMREVLGYIAVAHAGNWIITDANKLRLIGLADVGEETNYLISDDGGILVFGSTKILV